MPRCRPSITPGPMACILVLMLAISTSSSSVHRRIDVVLVHGLAGGGRVERAGAQHVLGEDAGAAYTGSCRSGMNCCCVGLHEPSARVHAPLATGPSNTQSGSGALHSALPASMSSLTHSATCSQPASCHSSNGPCLTPKPQRMRSRRRARCRQCCPGARRRSGSCCAACAHRNCACGLLDSRSSFRRSAAGFFSMRLDDGVGLAAGRHVVRRWRRRSAGCRCPPSCRSRRRSSGPARRLQQLVSTGGVAKLA